MSFCRSWAFFSRSFFLFSIFLSSWTRYSSSATCRENKEGAIFILYLKTSYEHCKQWHLKCPFLVLAIFKLWTAALQHSSNLKVTNLLRCAIKQLLQLLFAALFMAGIKDVDLGLCPRCCPDLVQLTTNIIVSFFQVLYWAFLNIIMEEN